MERKLDFRETLQKVILEIPVFPILFSKGGTLNQPQTALTSSPDQSCSFNLNVFLEEEKRQWQFNR
jgi:hypothetical protein